MKIQYQAFVFLPNTSHITMQDLAQKLQARFSQPVMNIKNLDITPRGSYALELRYDFFSFRFELTSDDEVKEEAEYFLRDKPNIDKTIGYNTKIALYSDADPTMDYFNDYIFVLQVLEELESAIIIDPRNGELI